MDRLDLETLHLYQLRQFQTATDVLRPLPPSSVNRDAAEEVFMEHASILDLIDIEFNVRALADGNRGKRPGVTPRTLVEEARSLTVGFPPPSNDS